MTPAAASSSVEVRATPAQQMCCSRDNPHQLPISPQWHILLSLRGSARRNQCFKPMKLPLIGNQGILRQAEGRPYTRLCCCKSPHCASANTQLPGEEVQREGLQLSRPHRRRWQGPGCAPRRPPPTRGCWRRWRHPRRGPLTRPVAAVRNLSTRQRHLVSPAPSQR